MRGPVPKRSKDRVNRIKPPIETVTAAGAKEVPVPRVDGHWHPVAKRWFRSLKESGQSQFYEPSDWAYAYFVAQQMTELLKQPRFMANGLKAVTECMNDLLTTEASRRRVRIELERAEESNVKNLVALDDYRALYG